MIFFYKNPNLKKFFFFGGGEGEGGGVGGRDKGRIMNPKLK